jgi:hypothetical protein
MHYNQANSDWLKNTHLCEQIPFRYGYRCFNLTYDISQKQLLIHTGRSAKIWQIILVKNYIL